MTGMERDRRKKPSADTAFEHVTFISFINHGVFSLSVSLSVPSFACLFDRDLRDPVCERMAHIGYGRKCFLDFRKRLARFTAVDQDFAKFFGEMPDYLKKPIVDKESLLAYWKGIEEHYGDWQETDGGIKYKCGPQHLDKIVCYAFYADIITRIAEAKDLSDDKVLELWLTTGWVANQVRWLDIVGDYLNWTED